jgi:hypothetical protein
MSEKKFNMKFWKNKINVYMRRTTSNGNFDQKERDRQDMVPISNFSKQYQTVDHFSTLHVRKICYTNSIKHRHTFK